MIKRIKNFLGSSNAKKPTTDFSSAEKKKLLAGVVREANKDQRDLISKYNISKKAYQQ